jgi:hypothetical protein
MTHQQNTLACCLSREVVSPPLRVLTFDIEDGRANINALFNFLTYREPSLQRLTLYGKQSLRTSMNKITI